jgi:hypothetical protein
MKEKIFYINKILDISSSYLEEIFSKERLNELFTELNYLESKTNKKEIIDE